MSINYRNFIRIFDSKFYSYYYYYDFFRKKIIVKNLLGKEVEYEFLNFIIKNNISNDRWIVNFFYRCYKKEIDIKEILKFYSEKKIGFYDLKKVNMFLEDNFLEFVINSKIKRERLEFFYNFYKKGYSIKEILDFYKKEELSFDDLNTLKYLYKDKFLKFIVSNEIKDNEKIDFFYNLYNCSMEEILDFYKKKKLSFEDLKMLRSFYEDKFLEIIVSYEIKDVEKMNFYYKCYKGELSIEEILDFYYKRVVDFDDLNRIDLLGFVRNDFLNFIVWGEKRDDEVIDFFYRCYKKEIDIKEILEFYYKGKITFDDLKKVNKYYPHKILYYIIEKKITNIKKIEFFYKYYKDELSAKDVIKFYMEDIISFDEMESVKDKVENKVEDEFENKFLRFIINNKIYDRDYVRCFYPFYKDKLNENVNSDKIIKFLSDVDMGHLVKNKEKLEVIYDLNKKGFDKEYIGDFIYDNFFYICKVLNLDDLKDIKNERDLKIKVLNKLDLEDINVDNMSDMDLLNIVILLKECDRKLLNLKEGVYKGNLSISVKFYNTIKNLNFLKILGIREIRGNFSCMSVFLESLEGCPVRIYGDFDCSHNRSLKSLKGCPSYVGGVFDCSDCELRKIDLDEGITIEKDLICLRGNYVKKNQVEEYIKENNINLGGEIK